MLASLDNSAFSQWLLQSNSVWAYPTVLTLHTFGMMVLVGAAAIIDLRLIGFGRAIPLKAMRTLFSILWGALVINAVTGTMLFVAAATKRATQPMFLFKLVLIALGLVTVVLIRRRISEAPDDAVTVPGSVKALAAVSLLLWGSAVTAGRLLAYVT